MKKTKVCNGCGRDLTPYKRIGGFVYCKTCTSKLVIAKQPKAPVAKTNSSTVCSDCQKVKPYANKKRKLCFTCFNKFKKERDKERSERRKKLKRESITQVKLDQVTSWLVRTLYPPKCPHCDVDLEYKTSNCGHFVSRTKQSTRFSLKNLCAVDRNCNFYVPEHVWSIGKFLDKVWGKGTADKQIEIAQRKLKLTPSERREIYLVYKDALDRSLGLDQDQKYKLLEETQLKYEAIINPLIK